MEWKRREQVKNFSWNAWLDRVRLMSQWITPDIHSIIDLGAGGMVLKNMLSPSVRYYPVDYIVRTDETIVADFNKNEFPDISADCCFCAGILEYVDDLEWFVDEISKTGCKYVLCSYSIKLQNQSIEERRQSAWVNDLSFEDLLQLFYRHGFILTDWNKHYSFSPLLRFEKATSISLTQNYFCTGCGACISSCSTNALSMVENEEGFLKPSIDVAKCNNCGKCVNVCHVLKEKRKNAICPAAYGVQASDEIRKDSTSGGIFSLLALEILRRDGVVFGAAWNNDFSVSHRAINSEKDINLLQHSKYIESRIDGSYIKAKKYLDEGKYVLFVGTPCQISGLFSYLNHNYSKLITVDLLCHYVPSASIFKKYVNENFSEVEKYTFRDKTYGWKPGIVKINFGGHEVIHNFYNDWFQKGFHPRLFMNDVCAECRYADFPRVGDLTIGDLWGLVSDPKWNDEKGTSEVLVNTLKGQEVLNAVKDNCKKIERIPIEITYENRIKTKYEPHPQRDYFNKLVKKETFNEAVYRALNNKFEIGLVGDWSVENYGANITYYALYSVLHDQLEKDVLLIERPDSSEWRPKKPPTLFLELPYPTYAVAQYATDKSGLYRFNENCDTFILGSDQIWNNYLYRSFGEFADFKWVNNNKRKIAYATSFGADYITGTEEDRLMLKEGLERFDAISVREKSAVKLLKDSFGVEGFWVLDPVFLCDKRNYMNLAKLGGMIEQEKKQYIFSYMLDITKEKADLIELISEKKCVPVITVTDAAKDIEAEQKKWDIALESKVCVEEWLADMICCEAMITDSFHGVCMAIIFHKPFIVIVNSDRGATRFYSLLETLHLENHLFESVEKAAEHLELLNEDSIIWDTVDNILVKEKESSLNWLKNAISSSMPKRERDAYDRLAPDVVSHSEHIHYIDNYSYLDVLPSQAQSGKRTRLALGDQFLVFQIWGENGQLEFNQLVAMQNELEPLKNQITELLGKYQDISSELSKIEKRNDELVDADEQIKLHMKESLEESVNHINDNVNQIQSDIEMRQNRLEQDMLGLVQNLQALEQRYELTSQELHRVNNSLSFKVGRVITWIPRMIKKIVRPRR